MEVAEKIEEIRKAKMISLTEMARKADMTPANYWSIIHAGNPTAKTLKKFADALGVPVSDFFGNKV